MPIYNRFFAGHPVVSIESTDRELLPPSVKLADMLAAIDAIRGGKITAPNTGSAGLADPRLGLR